MRHEGLMKDEGTQMNNIAAINNAARRRTTEAWRNAAPRRTAVARRSMPARIKPFLKQHSTYKNSLV
jgi:hypothetical protein